MLQTVLKAFSQILEVASLKEIGNFAEEFLGYLKSLVVMEPTTSILCVQQVIQVVLNGKNKEQNAKLQRAEMGP